MVYKFYDTLALINDRYNLFENPTGVKTVISDLAFCELLQLKKTSTEAYETCQKLSKATLRDYIYYEYNSDMLKHLNNNHDIINLKHLAVALDFDKNKHPDEVIFVTGDREIGKFANYYFGQDSIIFLDKIALKSKYTEEKPPIQCLITNNICHNKQRQKPQGIVLHTLGLDNTGFIGSLSLNEYCDFPEEYTLRKKSRYPGDWNRPNRLAGANAIIGKTSFDELITIQTYPWETICYQCGLGSNGTCDNDWIQVVLCDRISMIEYDYWRELYKEALDLSIYLCRLYDINPIGQYQNIPTILSHEEAAKKGMATPHIDIEPYFLKINKNMNIFRQEIYNSLKMAF